MTNKPTCQICGVEPATVSYNGMMIGKECHDWLKAQTQEEPQDEEARRKL